MKKQGSSSVRLIWRNWKSILRSTVLRVRPLSPWLLRMGHDPTLVNANIMLWGCPAPRQHCSVRPLNPRIVQGSHRNLVWSEAC